MFCKYTALPVEENQQRKTFWCLGDILSWSGDPGLQLHIVAIPEAANSPRCCGIQKKSYWETFQKTVKNDGHLTTRYVVPPQPAVPRLEGQEVGQVKRGRVYATERRRQRRRLEQRRRAEVGSRQETKQRPPLSRQPHSHFPHNPAFPHHRPLVRTTRPSSLLDDNPILRVPTATYLLRLFGNNLLPVYPTNINRYQYSMGHVINWFLSEVGWLNYSMSYLSVTAKPLLMSPPSNSDDLGVLETVLF
ncbi:hypothetical protein AAG570_000199 [Ranatra chinensis]|uniref:Uncharacterized protein n=1 Tax=Ranatra chinensis TaxID=642074 RepID=A0ABD0YWE2_9HEMI